MRRPIDANRRYVYKLGHDAADTATRNGDATMDMKTINRLLREAQEAVERLACGEDGMLDNADTAQDVADLLIEAQALAQLVEDETNRRFTRLDDSEIEDIVNGWFDESGKVAARRGE